MVVRIMYEAEEAPSYPTSAADQIAIREQTQRLLADTQFHNSKRCSDMLLYIVNRTLEGQLDCLKERMIGIEVFARTPDYDTAADSIVRNAAAEIRKRLARYYQEPAHLHELRIALPTGSYIPEFHRRDPAPVEALQHEIQVSPDAVAGQPELPTPRSSLRYALSSRLYLSLAASAIILIALLFGLERYQHRSSVLESFWAPLLHSSAPVLICIGAPAPEAPKPIPAGASPGATQPGIALKDYIAQQVNFPVSDLSAANAITSFLAHRGTESNIRLAGSTSLADLRGNPIVVLGSFPNEWALRLGKSLPFQFRRDGSVQWIADSRNPLDRKWSLNVETPFEQVTDEYTLITRCFDRTTGQWWIGIGGLTVLGTIDGQQVLSDPNAMAAFNPQLPLGWSRNNLQMVLQIKLVNGSAGAASVVASQSW